MEGKGHRIIFERRLPKEARREDDDWNGLSEAKIRRRIQNRLHQRSYRRRRALNRESKKAAASAIHPRNPALLAPRQSVPAADQVWIDPVFASRTSPSASDQAQQISLHRQTVFPQIASASPATACADMLSDPQVRRLHHYAFTVLWPSFKHYSLETSESLTSAFFRLGMRDDLLLASFIWPAALAMSMHLPHTSMENDAVMLACQNKVVNSIREHIESNNVSESVIFAVLTLTISNTNPSKAMQEDSDDLDSGFDPPFRSLGWNQFQSRFTFTRSHVQALARLVASVGGLQNVSTPGIAEQVQSTDILQASLSLSRPHFTLCRLYQHVLDNHMKMIRPPRERIECVFPVTNFEFKDLLLDIRMYCRHLETLVDKTPGGGSNHGLPASLSWETNVYRNLIQHRLLHLPRYEAQEEELCRLATLIFSYGVIYPLARRRPLHGLVRQLRDALEAHQGSLGSGEAQNKAALAEPTTTSSSQAAARTDTEGCRMPEFSLWIILMGALAAKATEHEGFFVHLLQTRATALKIANFAQLIDIMRQFLWLQKACDVGAFELWTSIDGYTDDPGPSSRDRSHQEEVSRKGQVEMIDLICTGVYYVPAQ